MARGHVWQGVSIAGGMHGRGACMGGGMRGRGGMRDTVNERAVRILLESILVGICN